MGDLDLHIIQGTAGKYPPAQINIIIDVIRAFTVSHLAFMRGAREIFLVNTVEEALALKALNPGYLLAGEVAGLPIAGFDLDNSPHTFSLADVDNRSLVQKTTNGVKGTLLALDAELILVTGFSNARKTAHYARQMAEGHAGCRVNVVATHPSGDDDLACAHFIQSQMRGDGLVGVEAVQQRINTSRAAGKFFDPAQPEFNEKDMPFCTREVDCNFVMQVDKRLPLPRIVKFQVD